MMAVAVMIKKRVYARRVSPLSSAPYELLRSEEELTAANHGRKHPSVHMVYVLYSLCAWSICSEP